ncbi:MAG: glutathione S-transferase family protein [Hyphomicrobiales bacterium]|nr:glutathione S-transferase family protein [Hyphomicrobiales bacterium]
MLELYNFAQSTCSLKVRICLAEKELDWVDRRLVSKNHDHLSDWYLKLNPNGVVPTLIHDGRPVFESSVIMEYLDEVFPERSLAPADAYDRAQMRSWLAYVDQVTTPAGRYPSFQFGGLLLKFQNMSDEEFADKTRRRPVKSAFYRKMDKNTGFAGELLEEAFRDIRNSAARMDQLLQQNGGPWLLGEQFTLADIAVAPLIDRQEDIGLEYLWEENCPSVADWLRRIQARPAYKKAYYRGSRLSEIYPELKLGRGSHRHMLDRGAIAASA